MLTIDGTYGEGGGQIIRSALTLACITGNHITVENIRAGRNPGGLRAQHLTSIHAAAEICDAEVSGDFMGSEKLVFRPTRAIKPGVYDWSVGTAGAATLVLQTVLLPLTLAEGRSEVRVEGGTHVPWSPSAHYLRDVYMPMLVQSGADLYIEIARMGWYPKGGGEIRAEVEGWAQLQGQDLSERGALERVFGVGLASRLPSHIPQRMTSHTQRLLKDISPMLDVRPQRDGGAMSPGAALCLTAEYENGRAGFTALGERGLSSEHVAQEAAYALQIFQAGIASVDEYLADQLVLILALAEGRSVFITPEVTDHLRTNIWVIQKFLEREIKLDAATGRVEIAG